MAKEGADQNTMDRIAVILMVTVMVTVTIPATDTTLNITVRNAISTNHILDIIHPLDTAIRPRNGG